MQEVEQPERIAVGGVRARRCVLTSSADQTSATPRPGDSVVEDGQMESGERACCCG